MRIKSYTAESFAAALKQVRSELGGDALVLKTRKLVNPLGMARVEVTACAGEETGEQAHLLNAVPVKSNPQQSTIQTESLVKPQSESNEKELHFTRVMTKLDTIDSKLSELVNRPNIQRESEATRKFRQILQDADFDANVIESIIAKSGNPESNRDDSNSTESVRNCLMEELSAIILPDLKFKSGDRIVLVGPAGAGKSSVMGKIATHLVSQERLAVTLQSLDDFKIGGREEIASYAELLGLEYQHDSVRVDAGNKSKKCVTLIDTPALSSEPNATELLCRKVDELKPTHRLFIFSALTRTSDLIQLTNVARAFESTHLVATMLDLTNCYGGLVSASHLLKSKLIFVTSAPGGIGDLKAPDPAELADKILNPASEMCKC